jgi:hypothetical protein
MYSPFKIKIITYLSNVIYSGTLVVVVASPCVLGAKSGCQKWLKRNSTLVLPNVILLTKLLLSFGFCL